MTGISAIVFDLDGTLYVSDALGEEIAAAANRYVAELHAATVTDAERLLREAKERLTAKQAGAATLSQACLALGGDLPELHRRFAAEIDPARLLRRDERVVALLRRLGERFDLYLYTNNNRSLSGRIIAALGVAGLFRHIYTIEDSWRPKPDRDTLAKILHDIDRQPGECLFVGDRYDIDLRLPAELGCAVFLAQSVEQLLSLNSIIQ